MIYSYDEAMEATKEYFGGEELPANIVLSKYLLRDEKNQLVEKTPRDKHRRIAKELARIEAKKFRHPYTEDEIFGWLDKYDYIIPQGSPMYGIGNTSQYISVSNCFVVEPPVDSYGGIHKTDEQLTQISKRRGGVGTDLSAIRPANFPTKNSSRNSTGIIPFAERFSNSIREVGQDGRRGALMLTLDVLHPEIIGFINMKRDKKKVTGANVSTRVRDEFLEAVENNTQYRQRWPIEGLAKYERLFDARVVWDNIIDAAWDNAEPGVLFWDNILRESPADCYSKFGFRTVSTNPCGELPLCILDSCRLLVLNLFKFVKFPYTAKAYFDYAEFYKFAQIAQRLMDDIIDLELECIDRIIDKVENDPELAEVKARELGMWVEVRSKCYNGRRTGTGITALGDAIAALGVKYGSDESIRITEGIYQVLKFGAYRSSVDMAKEIGAFPIWDKELEKDNPFLNRIADEFFRIDDKNDISIIGEEIYWDMQHYGRRNIALLTTAPVGTVSNLIHLLDDIFGSTSGIEPAYLVSYDRFKKINPGDAHNARVDRVDDMGDKWQKFTVYHPGVKAWQKVTGKVDVKESPYWGCCAGDLDWKQRVKLQAAAQRHVDHSISSTVNLPNHATKEQVDEIFRTAWKSGLKGITIYRDGCRDGVLVDNKAKEEQTKTIISNNAPKRPNELKCDVHHIKIKGDKEFFVLVGLIGKDPYEVLAGENGMLSKKAKIGTVTKVKRGQYKLTCDTGEVLESVTEHSSDDEEAITRMVSTALRHGADIQHICEQLSKTKGHLTSFSKSLARALKTYIKDGKKVSGASCPDCGGDLKYSEGCASCSCGFSKCS